MVNLARFIVFVFVFFSCSKTVAPISHELKDIDIDLLRFEKKFYGELEIPLDSIMKDFPYFFPNETPYHIWLNKRKDSTQQLLYNETSKISNHELPCTKVFESDQILAFNDIDPKAPVHIIVIPKKHISTINDLNESDRKLMGDLIFSAKIIAEKINVKESGFRCIFNTNNDGGQTVFHIHMHLLAGRELSWPPG